VIKAIDETRIENTRSNGSSNLEILTAAAECFMEQGFHATSIDDVARRLGATKGRIYHYYSSKTDLFFDVHREGMARLFNAVKPAMKGEGDGVTRLGRMLKNHALAMMESLAFETVVVQGVHMHRLGATTPAQRRTLDELMIIRDEFETLFKIVAYEAAEDGSLASRDISITVKTILGAINWLAIWYRPRPDETEVDREILAAKIVETILSGLRRRE